MAKAYYRETEETLLLHRYGWRRVNQGLGWQFKDELRTYDFDHAMLRLQMQLEAEKARREYQKSLELVDPESFTGRVIYFAGMVFRLLALPLRLLFKIKW